MKITKKQLRELIEECVDDNIKKLNESFVHQTAEKTEQTVLEDNPMKQKLYLESREILNQLYDCGRKRGGRTNKEKELRFDLQKKYVELFLKIFGPERFLKVLLKHSDKSFEILQLFDAAKWNKITSEDDGEYFRDISFDKDESYTYARDFLDNNY